MESTGAPVSPSALELTIATPACGNVVNNSPSSGFDNGHKGSNIENNRELALLDAFDHPLSGGEEDAEAHAGMEKEGNEDTQPVGVGPAFQPRRKRLSHYQSRMLEESFQQNNNPDKVTKQALADTVNVTLKQVHTWFLNRRARLKKDKMEQDEKELNGYKSQVESLTDETHYLRCKLKKLKKKYNKLKLKQAPPPMALPLPPPPPPQAIAAAAAAVEQQQHQNQVMYVPVLTGLFANREQSVATTTVTTAPFNAQQGRATAIPGLPIAANTLQLPPPSDYSNN